MRLLLYVHVRLTYNHTATAHTYNATNAHAQGSIRRIEVKKLLPYWSQSDYNAKYINISNTLPFPLSGVWWTHFSGTVLCGLWTSHPNLWVLMDSWSPSWRASSSTNRTLQTSCWCSPVDIACSHSSAPRERVRLCNNTEINGKTPQQCSIWRVNHHVTLRIIWNWISETDLKQILQMWYTHVNTIVSILKDN